MSGASAVASFEFLSAGRVVFGAGCAKSLGERARRFGTRALFVTGRARERVATLEADLRRVGVDVAWVGVAGEPRIEDVLAAVEAGRRVGAELVVACGGGSAIDLGKAAAALLANTGSPLDFFFFLTY